MTKCNSPSCERYAKARGYCNKHLSRLYRGVPIEDRPPPPRAIRAVCSGCERPRFKGSPDFHLDKRTGTPRAKCKLCTNGESKSWHRRNPEQSLNARMESNRRWHPRVRYGLERDEYERLLAGFGPLCGICGKPETRRDRKTLCLDHDHKTDKIRGALCSKCNILLGLMDDNPELLDRAAAYLRTAATTPTAELLGGRLRESLVAVLPSV